MLLLASVVRSSRTAETLVRTHLLMAHNYSAPISMFILHNIRRYTQTQADRQKHIHTYDGTDTQLQRRTDQRIFSAKKRASAHEHIEVFRTADRYIISIFFRPFFPSSHLPAVSVNYNGKPIKRFLPPRTRSLSRSLPHTQTHALAHAHHTGVRSQFRSIQSSSAINSITNEMIIF